MDAELFDKCLQAWNSSAEALDEAWQACENSRLRSGYAEKEARARFSLGLFVTPAEIAMFDLR